MRVGGLALWHLEDEVGLGGGWLPCERRHALGQCVLFRLGKGRKHAKKPAEVACVEQAQVK